MGFILRPVECDANAAFRRSKASSSPIDKSYTSNRVNQLEVPSKTGDVAARRDRVTGLAPRLNDKNPGYFAPSGEGYSDKYVKFAEEKLQKLKDSDFQNVESLGFAFLPMGSESPAYASFFTLDFSYDDFLGLRLTLSCNSAIIPFRSDAFFDTINLFQISDWKFGFALEGQKLRKPALHVMSGSRGNLSDAEEAKLFEWDDTQYEPELRMTKLRDTYPVLVLGERHGSQTVFDGVTLLDYAAKTGDVTPFGTGAGHLWSIPNAAIENVDAELRNAGLLLS